MLVIIALYLDAALELMSKQRIKIFPLMPQKKGSYCLPSTLYRASILTANVQNLK